MPIPAPRILLGSGWWCVFMEREMALSIWQRKGEGIAAEQRSFICSIGRVYVVLCGVSAFRSEKKYKNFIKPMFEYNDWWFIVILWFPILWMHIIQFVLRLWRCRFSHHYQSLREDRGWKGEMTGCRGGLFIFRFTFWGISDFGNWSKSFMYSHFSFMLQQNQSGNQRIWTFDGMEANPHNYF